MKILYHHRTQSRDGQAVHIEELIGALRAKGAEIRVVAPPTHGVGTYDGRTWLGVLRKRLPKAFLELLELAYNGVAYLQLRRALAEQRPDILYERANLFLVVGVWLAKRRGLPVLLEVNSPLEQERSKHGGLGLAGLARWTEEYTWRNATAVLAVTQVLADIIASAGVPRDRIHVIPNGINAAMFASAPPKDEAKRMVGFEGRTVLGFIGFVRDWHGLDRVVDMLNLPDFQHCALLIVGDGPARASLEAQARRLGLEARVRFTGVLPHDAVPARLAAFDIALQPGLTPYASPLKLFEYMHMSKAIVAPDQPNIAEVLKHQRDALLFTPGAAEEMREAIVQLVQRQELRERIAAAARATLDSGGYTWARNADRVLAIAAGKQ